MAFAFVQSRASGDFDGVDSGGLAYNSNVVSGNLLICAGSAWHSTTAPTSVVVTDSLGSSWTTVLGAVRAGMTWRTFIAYAVAASSAACTVTVNPNTATNSFSFSVGEFSGPHATPASVNGGDSTGDTNAPADSITTAEADELIIGILSHDSPTATLTAGTNYTIIGENETNSSNQCHHGEYRIATTATSYSVTWTCGAIVNWSCQTHSFKPDTGGATGHPAIRRMGGVEFAARAGGFRTW